MEETKETAMQLKAVTSLLFLRGAWNWNGECMEAYLGSLGWK